jgi:hypothetical protein
MNVDRNRIDKFLARNPQVDMDADRFERCLAESDPKNFKFSVRDGAIVRMATSTVGDVLKPMLKSIKAAIDTLESKVASLESIAPLTVRQLEDPRDIELILANGERTVFHIPSMIYAGVYMAKTEYRKGDCVTYDGCVWVCTTQRTTYSPAASSDWQLAVRKGKNAKQLREEPG